MHRRSSLTFVVLVLATAGSCVQPPRTNTGVRPRLGQQSLGDTMLASGLPEAAPHRGCSAGLTADECMRVDSAIVALQMHRDPPCRAVGDSARAREYRGGLGFVQPALSSAGNRRYSDGMVAVAQPGGMWVGAQQFDWRGVLMEALARALTTDSVARDSVAAACRRAGF